MKKTTAIGVLSVAAVVALALSPVSPLQAHNVTDSSGAVVRDSSKSCVNDSTFSEADRTVECGAEPPKVVEAPKPVAAPAPAPAPVAPAPVAPTIETVEISGEALFALDSSRLSDNGKSALDGVVNQLRGFDKVKSIIVTGHTDSSGSDAYNQKLSEKRAKTVVDYMTSRGVNPALLTAAGKGESSPIASNATKEGRQQNRRVTIDIDGSKIVGTSN